MKIELVCPAAEDSAFLRSSAVAVLTGLTPPDVRLSLKDDIIHRLDPTRDLDLDADLAAITLSTKTASRAYELAAAYRAAGVKVVLGGIHPTALPEEGLEHADAVVVGEAEGLWQRVIADAKARSLQPIYRHESLPDYSHGTRADWRLFRSRRYIPIYTLQASRGCPYDCEFCSVTPFFGHQLRRRDPKDLAAEIERLDGRWVMFADDNIITSPGHTRRLLDALEPMKLRWYGQASLQGLKDEQTVRRLARSGCRALFIGFESVNPRSIAGCGKRQNDPAQYLDRVRLLHDHGIAIWASFVFGLDQDEPDIFERTLEFALRARFFMATFAIQTPYPGTRLFKRLDQEGRLLDHTWWLKSERNDFPLYRPRLMTPEQLYRGWQQTWKQFYSSSSILKRFQLRTSLHNILGYLPLNLLQHRLVSSKILGGDKFFRRDH